MYIRAMENGKINTDTLKVGDFIQGSYKRHPRFGVVIEIKKDIVVIKNCKGSFGKFIICDDYINNIKINTIQQIGLLQNQTIVGL
jgi:hypothetical protein